jgi:hypothetical protein
MALYRYVATKDDLHQLMLDAAMSSSLAPIVAADWQSGFRELLRGLVAGYREHPWALDIPLTPHIHLMPGQMRVADVGLCAMRSLQALPQTKLGILMMLSAFARGHAEVEREVLADIGVGSETRALIEEAVSTANLSEVELLVRNGAYFGDPPPGTDPAAEGAGAGGAEAEADAILEFATQVLLSGLSETLASLPQDTAAEARAQVPPTPQEAYERAEASLHAHKDLRKRTQQRIRELEREEAGLQKARDRAKELAKAHARLAQE